MLEPVTKHRTDNTRGYGSFPGLFLERVFIGLQNPLLDQFIGLWSMLDLLFEAVCAHMSVEGALACLESRGGVGFWEDIPYAGVSMVPHQGAIVLTFDQFLAFRSFLQMLPQIVRLFLALEFMLLGL